MGSSASKQSSQDSQHVFSASGPVRFSEGLVNSIQSKAETDSTREKNLELMIQARVASELEKHLESSRTKLSQTSDSISKEPFEPSKDNPASSNPNLDRSAVAQDIEELRKKLSQRKKITELDEGVKQAKEAVVACLRMNDRRPLDCWKEVESFKAEVGRLEREFVARNGGS